MLVPLPLPPPIGAAARANHAVYTVQTGVGRWTYAARAPTRKRGGSRRPGGAGEPPEGLAQGAYRELGSPGVVGALRGRCGLR